MKDTLNSMKRNRLSRYGGRKATAVIVTEMVIKEPLFGGSIQSNTLKTKTLVREPGEAVVRQTKPPQRGDPFTLISEKWFLDMLSFHRHSFVNHLLHFKV